MRRPFVAVRILLWSQLISQAQSETVPSLVKLWRRPMSKRPCIYQRDSLFVSDSPSFSSIIMTFRGGAAKSRRGSLPLERDRDVFDNMASISRDIYRTATDPDGVVMQLLRNGTALASRALLSASRSLQQNEARTSMSNEPTEQTSGSSGATRTATQPPSTASSIKEMSSQDSALRSPRRFVGLTITAWLLSELLDLVGLLPGDDAGGKNSIRYKWKQHPLVLQCRKHCAILRTTAWTWWSSQVSKARQMLEKMPPLKSMPPKYQWAVGATAGMIISPWTLPMLCLLLQGGALLYALAVLNDSGKQASIQWKFMVEDPIHGGWLERLDAHLVRWRDLIDAAMANPEELLNKAANGDLWFSSENITVELQQGVLCGIGIGVLLHV